jgi:hypothetical protein
MFKDEIEDKNWLKDELIGKKKKWKISFCPVSNYRGC